MSLSLKNTLSAVILMVFAGLSGLGAADAQVIVDGSSTIVTPSSSAAMSGEDPFGSPQPVPPSYAPKPVEAKPDKKKDKKKDTEKDKKKDKEKDKDKKDSKESKTVSRPTEPPKPPNPKELEAGLDDDGLVQFNFKGQPWPAVLEWLARISDMSLDWLELPGDYVNLTTRRRYSVEEARNLINRLLLDRGFTILCEGEVMSVVKLKDLNPSKVPRVLPEKLGEHQDYEFVKVSFPLTRLVAEKAVEELKPYSSTNGRLTAMAATNRIEAMDAVANLRDIWKLLTREQSADWRNRPPWVKKLQYRRASEVVAHLESLLGIASGPAGAMSADQQKALQEAMRKAAQQKGKKNGQPSPQANAEVHLVADKWNNTIIVHAPPDKLAIIQEAVKAIDVRPQASVSVEAMLGRVQRYHLSTMDPEPVVKALQEIGNLGPMTEFAIDSDSNTFIASASLADHLKISRLVRQLDGTGRTSSVIILRRLPADYVAGTIRQLLFGGTEETKKKRSFSLYNWDSYGSRSSSKKKKGDRFRVDADVETNRLLLWANDYELAEVKNFLISLGENPDEQANRETIRVLDVLDDEGTKKLFEQLRKSWPQGDNRLMIEEEQSEEPAADQQTRRSSRRRNAGPRITFAQLRADLPDEKSTNHDERPPIVIRRNASGRLVISSHDTAALDRLENMVAKLAPPTKNYKIFPLTHANCLDVLDILKDYFKNETGPDLEEVYRAGWYGDRINVNDDNGSVGLSSRRPLRFIADIESNSILVKDAAPGQLRMIDELIKFYNAPKSIDSENARQQGFFRIRYSKASDIARTIKSLYRDLLSPNDKAFEGKNRGRSESSHRYVYRIFDNGDGESLERAPKFKGLLSMGVDDRSNTLLLSAPKYLYKHVAKLVVELDEAAKPAVSTISVVKLGQGIDAAMLERALSEMVDESSSSPKIQPSYNPPEQHPTSERH